MEMHGHILQDRGHVLYAIVAYTHADRLAPMDAIIMGFVLNMLNKDIDQRRDGEKSSNYRQAKMSGRTFTPCQRALSSTTRTSDAKRDRKPKSNRETK